MNDQQMTTCPHCGASFQVSRAQLEQAGGRVRCGNCLQIFDGIRGEIDFIAPTLPDEVGPHPILELEVRHMLAADLPEANDRISWSAWTILLALLTVLAAQLYLPQLEEARRARDSLQLANLVIRPHPEVAGALRLDAVIRNPAAEASPLPLLVLGFTNRQGEPRARRAFLPAEYLHGSGPLRLPPNSEIQVSMALADPGRDAVNYLARLEPVVARAD
ncbi:MAG: DUF3426 domain-containing protein [Halieaceae bacterium]|nr:DUF3426 domain-containing protein [Halieaceae bacterium]